MIKKFLLLLLSAITVFSAAFAEDSQLLIDYTVHSAAGESTEIMYVRAADGKLTVLSSLFPGSCIMDTLPEGAPAFTATDSGSFPDFAFPDFRNIVRLWGTALRPQSKTGLFSGDAFETATSMDYCTCSRLDLLSLCTHILETAAPEAVNLMISSVTSSDMAEMLTGGRERITCRIYDEGKYLSLTGNIQDSTVFTLCFNFADPDLVHAVFGYADSGVNYYWSVQAQVVSGHRISVSSALRADYRKAGYRICMYDEPILREDLTLNLSEDNKQIDFESRMTPQNGLNSLLLNGTFKPWTDDLCRVEARFSGMPEEQYISLAIQKSGRTMETAAKKTFTLKEVLAPESGNKLVAEVNGRIQFIYAATVSVIPEVYLTKLLFQ